MKMITENLKFADIFPDKAAEFAQRLHIKKDEIPFVRKYYTAEKGKTEVKKKERAVVSYISTGIKDRDGEKLVPEGVILDNYLKNPVVPFAHNYKSIPPAKNMWIKRDEKGLVAKTIFAKSKQAEEYYQAYTEDVGGTGPLLNAFSVGFIPLEWEDTEAKAMEKDPDLPKRIYNKWELLEYSLVPIPSCHEALTIAQEKGLFSKKLLKELEIEVVKDVEDKEIEVEIVSHPIAKETVPAETISGEQEIEVELEVDKELFKVDAMKKELVKQGFYESEEDIEEFKRWSEHINYDDDAIGVQFGERGFLVDPNGKIKEIITKPETTANFHHIPVNPGCKITATITISADKGIKATYCGKVKKIHTYLFDVKKWTMDEAKVWVKENHKRALEEAIQKYFTKGISPEEEEYREIITSIIEEADKKRFGEIAKKPQYKERWNLSLSKLFDVASAESPIPLKFNFDLYEKFLECKVKEVFQNNYQIPSPLLGSYLAAFKAILGKFELKDTRYFGYGGDEMPPRYEVINLNSEKSDDFLVDGMQFYEAEKKPLIVSFSPEWFGLAVTLVTSNENKKWNKELLDKAHAWVHENNFLRGEKFALSGEFLKEPGDNWDNLILKDKYKDAIMTSAKALEKKGEKLVGRGLLFIGPPGTGKTKTGRVLMNELDATFIWISSRDFRYVGPMKALALGFSMARDLAPSVLFLEDIDTWLRGEMEFVTDLLKTEMDGIKQNKGMVTIMTSNYPEKLPDALLDRPGRFHHIVNFELPEKEHRKEMITLWAGDIDEKLLDELAEKTDGFSGAHLKELVEFAKMISDEEEIEIGDAMLRSLDKLMEQRELIDEIRANQEDAKAVWGRIKLIEGEIQVSETPEALSADLSDELSKELTDAIKGQQGEGEFEKELKEYAERVLEKTNFKEALNGVRILLEGHYEKLLQEKDEHIADLKAGRVLSRKNRNIVKAAESALKEVLKADAAGTQEDEDSESGGTVTEREIDIVKDGEKEFSMDDVRTLIKSEFTSPEMIKALENAFKKITDPEKIKEVIKEGVRLELQKIKGKVE